MLVVTAAAVTKNENAKQVSPRAKPRGPGRSSSNRRAPGRALRSAVAVPVRIGYSWRDQRSLSSERLRFLDSARNDMSGGGKMKGHCFKPAYAVVGLSCDIF